MKQYAVTTVLGLLVLTILQFITLAPSKEQLRMYFLDVGQGDSILVRFSTGEKLLIDAGRDSTVFRELDKVLPWYDKRIDYVLLTHGDLDHVGPVPDLLDRYSVYKIYVSEFFGRVEAEQAIQAKAQTDAVPIQTLKPGDVLTFGTQATSTLEIIHPNASCMQTYNSENECSLVGLLTYGTQTFLFTGDTGEKVEPQLAAQIERPITLLKVGHHGSRESTSAEFLAKLKPQYAVIQSGRDNDYGHPHQETSDRLAAASSTVFNTKDDTTIVVSSDGKSLEIKKLFDQTSLLQSGVCAVLLYGFEASC